jgi:hypothetical protein
VFAIYAVLLLLAVTLSRVAAPGRRVPQPAASVVGAARRHLRRRRLGRSRCAILTGAGDVRRGVHRRRSAEGGRSRGRLPVLGGFSALTVLVRAASIDAS